MSETTTTKKPAFILDTSAGTKFAEAAKKVAVHLDLIAAYGNKEAPKVYATEVKKALAEAKAALAILLPTEQKAKRKQSAEVKAERKAWGKRLYAMKQIDDDSSKTDEMKASEKQKLKDQHAAEFPKRKNNGTTAPQSKKTTK